MSVAKHPLSSPKMILIQLLVLPAIILAATFPDEENPACPSGWINAHDDGCFRLMPDESGVNWIEAHLACESVGGYLAEPASLEQMEFLTGIAEVEETFTDIKTWWIGMSDIGHEGLWTWQHSGEQVESNFWGKGSPTNSSSNSHDCGYMELTKGDLVWRDTDCLATAAHGDLAPACQREMERGNGSLTTTEPPLVSCPIGWSEFNGTCFEFILSGRSWLDAEDDCVEEGGHLASVHTFTEYKFVLSLTTESSLEHIWLGATDSLHEGSWVWSDGSAWDYQDDGFVQDGLEAQNCLAYQADYPDNDWVDKPCYMEFSYMCKITLV